MPNMRISNFNQTHYYRMQRHARGSTKMRHTETLSRCTGHQRRFHKIFLSFMNYIKFYNLVSVIKDVKQANCLVIEP